MHFKLLVVKEVYFEILSWGGVLFKPQHSSNILMHCKLLYCTCDLRYFDVIKCFFLCSQYTFLLAFGLTNKLCHIRFFTSWLTSTKLHLVHIELDSKDSLRKKKKTWFPLNRWLTAALHLKFSHDVIQVIASSPNQIHTCIFTTSDLFIISISNDIFLIPLRLIAVGQ